MQVNILKSGRISISFSFFSSLAAFFSDYNVIYRFYLDNIGFFSRIFHSLKIV